MTIELEIKETVFKKIHNAMAECGEFRRGQLLFSEVSENYIDQLSHQLDSLLLDGNGYLKKRETPLPTVLLSYISDGREYSLGATIYQGNLRKRDFERGKDVLLNLFTSEEIEYNNIETTFFQETPKKEEDEQNSEGYILIPKTIDEILRCHDKDKFSTNIEINYSTRIEPDLNKPFHFISGALTERVIKKIHKREGILKLFGDKVETIRVPMLRQIPVATSITDENYLWFTSEIELFKDLVKKGVNGLVEFYLGSKERVPNKVMTLIRL